MCYEHRDEELAKVCKERDELKKIVSKQHNIIERLMAEPRERSSVVRCQECEHGDRVMETDDGCRHFVCKRNNWWVNPGYFCASGKRKDGKDG